MRKREPDPERIDGESPELTVEELRRAGPAAKVLPDIIGPNAARELLRRSRGRPLKSSRKHMPKQR